jgi:hypothetical protein
MVAEPVVACQRSDLSTERRTGWIRRVVNAMC